MYFLSLREINTGSTAVLSPQLYRYCAPQSHPVDWDNWQLTSAEPVDWAALRNVPHSHVCFVVHGFNVDRKRGSRSGGTIAQELDGPVTDLKPSVELSNADLVIPVLWPGDGFIAWSYFTAFTHAQEAGAKFAQFLLDPGFDADQVSFISHSLGARVVLQTIEQTLVLARRPLKFRFQKAILTAAAVDNDALDSGEFPNIASADGPTDIVVVSSMKDSILRTFFTIGDDVEGAMWDNYGGTGQALGRYGPALSPGSPVRAKTRWYDFQGRSNQGHDGYMPAPWEYPVGDKVPLAGWTCNIIRTWQFCHDMLEDRPSSVDPDWLAEKVI